MKKISKIILTIIILTSIFQNVVQATNDKMDIMNIELVEEDEYVTVYINISCADSSKGILAMQGTINYDKDVFELVDKTVQKDNWMLSAYNEESGIFIIEITDNAFFDTNSHIYDSENILEIQFKIKEDTKVKESTISVSEVKLVDDTYTTIDVYDKSVDIQVKKNNTFMIICLIVIIVIIISVIIIITKKKWQDK